MKKKNPWRQLPHDIYEKHMGHENVRQLEMLSRIFSGQLALVADIQKPTIAILGITGGNGLNNIEAGRYNVIIGIDINNEYLDICRDRYVHLPELELHQIDLMTEKDRAASILQQADLVTANLLIKHIHLNNFMDIISSLKKPIISVTVQFNPDGQSISNSGFEAAFEDIVKHSQTHDEVELTAAMREAGYALTGREEYELPNKKVFIRLDYKRPVAIRLAIPADAPDMAKVHMSSWEVAYKDIIPADFIREKNATRPELYKRVITDENTNTHVIQCNGKTVGIMRVAPPLDDDLGNEYYELHFLYLHPDYFRQGIGTQAMEFAFDIARNLGKTAMVVWVLEKNINSIKFYEKCGFSADGSSNERDFGEILRSIRMRREL